MTDSNGHAASGTPRRGRPRSADPLATEITVRLTAEMHAALAASAEWRRAGISVLVRDAITFYFLAQAAHLIRSGHPSALAELREDETPEAAQAEVERRRAALAAACFTPAPAPSLQSVVGVGR